MMAFRFPKRRLKMALTTAFGKGKLLGNDAVAIATMALRESHIFLGNSLQSFESPTWICDINTNAPENSTVGIGFIPLQRVVNYGDYSSDIGDISMSGISLVSFLNTSPVEEATETHGVNSYRSLLGTPLYDLVALLKDLSPSTEFMQREQETIRADTSQSLSFRDLVNALDRISRPTEMEDIPLPFDPDDYPVV
jgi:hypothetical protein